MLMYCSFSLHVRAVAKYCDEYICVCVSVCLSARISLQRRVWSLPNFLWMLLVAVDLSSSSKVKKSEGEGHFWGCSFLPYWHCIVQHSICNPYKNGWTDRDVVWDDEWAWPEEQCVVWGWQSPKGKEQHLRDKPHTPNNWKLHWSMQRNMTEADAWLQALDDSVVSR